MGDDKSLLWSLVILLGVKSSLGTAGRSVSVPCCSRGSEMSSSPAKPARKPCGASFPGDQWLCPQGRLEPVLKTQGAPSKPCWLFPGGTEWVNISLLALGLGLLGFSILCPSFLSPRQRKGMESRAFPHQGQLAGLAHPSESPTLFLCPLQWMRARWTSDPCYAFFGVDGTECSFLIYLSEVEWFCPPLPWRNRTVAVPSPPPPPRAQVRWAQPGFCQARGWILGEGLVWRLLEINIQCQQGPDASCGFL